MFETSSKKMVWAGYVLMAIPALMLLAGSVNAIRKADFVLEGTTKLGYPVDLVPTIGLIELVCAVLFVIPRTAVLGAILMTGYFGGAVASHLRVGDGMWPVPIVFGAMVWGSIFLRDRRWSMLLPLTR